MGSDCLPVGNTVRVSVDRRVNQRLDDRGLYRVVAPDGEGTGFGFAGYVLTNAHVVGSSPRVRLESSLGSFDSRVLVRDSHYDVAVLEAPPSGVGWSYKDVAIAQIALPAEQVGYESGRLGAIRGVVLDGERVKFMREHGRGMSGSPVFSGGKLVGMHYGDSACVGLMVSAVRFREIVSRAAGPSVGPGGPVGPPSGHRHTEYVLRTEWRSVSDRLSAIEERVKALESATVPPGGMSREEVIALLLEYSASLKLKAQLLDKDDKIISTQEFGVDKPLRLRLVPVESK